MGHDIINDYSYIKENLDIVRNRISETAVMNGRDPGEITLIGVSKTHPADAAAAAVKAGLNDLGENRTEELVQKYELLESDGLSPCWHMIGTLQRRKVRQITGKTCIIHSVDSWRLFDEIALRSVENGIVSETLIEMNISGEESKHGFSPSQLSEISEMMASGKDGVNIRGIMTMAPLTDDEKVIERIFDQTRQIFNSLAYSCSSGRFDTLSMGMSNDYHLAVKHGATHLRIGTAIFGKR